MMKLADKLSDRDKKKMDRLKSPKKEHKMSQDELEDLMGMRRDTYKRVHGKIRRR
jgi:DNA-binding XRE family transcriptional regulator